MRVCQFRHAGNFLILAPECQKINPTLKRWGCIHSNFYFKNYGPTTPVAPTPNIKATKEIAALAKNPTITATIA